VNGACDSPAANAIARALLVNPDVLVFDEATSSLDSESEQAIQRAMHEILGTRTTIAIAHRLSTIREADRIVVLDQGRIAEIGDHTSLLQQGGVYSRLYHLQEQGELY
jgi:ATP-binding cassette subfamily B protein